MSVKQGLQDLIINREKSASWSKQYGDRFIPQRTSLCSSNFTMMTVRELLDSDDEEVPRNKYNDMLRANLSNAETIKEKSKLFIYKNKGVKRSVTDSLCDKKIKLTNRRRSKFELPLAPYKILEAPCLEDDYYLSLLDWSRQNKLSICLADRLYILDITNDKMEKLYEAYECESISAVKWNPEGTKLAVGNVLGQVAIWDAEKGTEIQSIEHHVDRVATIDWASTILVGSKDGEISQIDIRLKGIVNKYRAHEEEVCKVIWSKDEKMFASGGNDNKLCVWNVNKNIPFMKEIHKGSIKALGWSHKQYGILASGGGINDNTLCIWNSSTKELLESRQTSSQICSLLFSTLTNDVITSHGFPNNEISIWRSKGLKKVGSLVSHTDRVLYTALSPCGSNLLTASPDETIRFWKLYHNEEVKDIENKSLISSISLVR